MALNNPIAGPSDAGQYMMSGIPWVTGSSVGTDVKKHEFPFVTKAITINNTDDANGQIFVGFSENGVAGSNRFQIMPSGSCRFEIRVKELYLVGSAADTEYSIMAELTRVSSRLFPVLTGSINGTNDPFEGIG